MVRLATGGDRLTFAGDAVFAVGFDHPRVVQRLRTRPREGGPRSGASFAGTGGDRRAAGGHSPVVPVRPPCGGRRRRLSVGTGRLGVLTACWGSKWPFSDLPRCLLLRRCWGDKRTSNALRRASWLMSTRPGTGVRSRQRHWPAIIASTVLAFDGLRRLRRSAAMTARLSRLSRVPDGNVSGAAQVPGTVGRMRAFLQQQ